MFLHIIQWMSDRFHPLAPFVGITSSSFVTYLAQSSAFIFSWSEGIFAMFFSIRPDWICPIEQELVGISGHINMASKFPISQEWYRLTDTSSQMQIDRAERPWEQDACSPSPPHLFQLNLFKNWLSYLSGHQLNGQGRPLGSSELELESGLQDLAALPSPRLPYRGTKRVWVEWRPTP